MLSRRLEMFLQVAEKGSFAKAAQAMYLSSVSVKKQIDSLETEVGVRLLDRTNQGVSLTKEGEAFYHEARKIPALAKRAIARAHEAHVPERHQIRLGTSLVRPCTPLTDFWWRMGGNELPFDLQIVPFEEDSNRVDDIVRSLGHEIDCFVAPCDSAYWRSVCNTFILCDIPLRLALPKTHPLARKSILTWDDLEGETIMLPQSNDYSVIPALQREIKEKHPGVHITRLPAHTDAAVFNLCAQGKGLMASYDIWENVHPMLATLAVDWSYRVPFGIMYAARASSAVTSFIQAVGEGLARYGWDA